MADNVKVPDEAKVEWEAPTLNKMPVSDSEGGIGSPSASDVNGYS